MTFNWIEMKIKINFPAFLSLFIACAGVILSSCSGKAVGEGVEGEKPMVQMPVDVDGDWRLVSYRIGHETRVYGKSCDYVLSFDEDDSSFDFTLNNDTIDGEYSIVDDTIRFTPDDLESEVHDEVLMIVNDEGCYALQDDDSMIVILPDECQAVFTRIK